MKKTRRNHLQSNKGFTLVEVLVAIVILGIIIVPLLNAFVMSANTNAKARQLLRSTTIAQNVIEELKAYSIDESASQFNRIETGNYVIADSAYSYEAVLDESTGAYTSVEITEDDEILGRKDGEYHFILDEVAMQSAKFDVAIHLTENENAGEYDLANITSMNRSDCAYYAQQEEADLNVASEYVRRREIYNSADAMTTAEFLAVMTRTITIDIDKAADGSESVKITYEYEVPTGLVNEDSRTYEEYTSIFDNYATKEPLQSVYLYYYPFYGTTTRDTFVINNNADSDTAVYLVKMKDANYTTFDNANYKPYVYVNEPTPREDGTSNMTLCTNIITDNLLSFYNGTGASTKLHVTDLGNSKTIQNLYDVTVEVYKHDDDAFATSGSSTVIKFDADKKISTFTGTVLDKAN